MQTPILKVKNLVKSYPEVTAVNDISFTIYQGECFGLLGPNGAGKTTSIEVIEGISPPTSGEILYKKMPRAETFREEIGIQLQNTELPQFLTVKETLETFRNLYNTKQELSRLIESCRLEEILARDNRKISGGQKQRLLLAIALANDPELIFLDEPTTGLDPQARRYLWDIVHRIKADNKTVILTTHYMEEAQILCDRVAIMDSGKIIVMGSPADLLKQYCSGTSIVLTENISDQDLEGIPCKWFRLEDRIEIQTTSINDCMQALMGKGVDLTSMTVRAQNL
ncbi:ABC transporter ATP-binding protein, partial [Thermodesulfobacteriota bacterium]